MTIDLEFAKFNEEVFNKHKLAESKILIYKIYPEMHGYIVVKDAKAPKISPIVQEVYLDLKDIDTYKEYVDTIKQIENDYKI